MFRTILLDFLNYALKSPKFSSNAFQKQLGSGLKLFCLKRDFDGNKTLLEFLYDQGMIKEREEVIALLIKIDHFRYQGAEEKKDSKRRIIKILRDSETGKFAIKSFLSQCCAQYYFGLDSVWIRHYLRLVLLLGPGGDRRGRKKRITDLCLFRLLHSSFLQNS